MKTIFIFLLLIFIIKSNDELPKNLKYYLYNYERSLHQTKIVACMNLVEYSLVNNKNNDLYNSIKFTNFDKEKFYYKFLMGMIVKCINNINENLIDYLISPENLNNYDLNNNKTLNDLIKINTDFNSITLTEEEELIYDEIQENVKQIEENKKNYENDYDYVVKVVKIVFIFILIAVSLLISQYYMNRKKPELDDATKEMIEMIKQKGKKSPKYNENINKDNKKDKKE